MQQKLSHHVINLFLTVFVLVSLLSGLAVFSGNIIPPTTVQLQPTSTPATLFPLDILLTLTPFVQPTPIITEWQSLISGQATLYTSLIQLDDERGLLDLDAGKIASAYEADFKFVMGRGTMIVFVVSPYNTARLEHAGDDEPGFTGCKDMLSKLRTTNDPRVYSGSYFCVLTNENRLAEVRLDNIDFYNQGYDAALSITFITWDEIIQ